MSKPDKLEGSLGDLARAAHALERELERFDEMSAAARRASLDTRKGVERAAKLTTEAARAQESVDPALRALVSAIEAARTRHEASVAALHARSEEIRARADQFGELYERYQALGEEGKLINQLVQEAAAKQREAKGEDASRDLVAMIEAIEDRMAKLVDGAQDLGQAARAAAITDLGEQADALRQQTASARNKLGLLRKSLARDLPDRPKIC